MRKTRNKVRTVSEAALGAGSRAFRRYGFSQREIISRWPHIVGSALADCSLPERLTFPRDEKRGGSLTIRVQGSMAPELQHFEPMIIERINGYYGYPAVDRLILRHGQVPVRSRKNKGKAPELTDSQQKKLQNQLCGVVNRDLYKALFRLGSELLCVKSPEKTTSKRRFTRRGMGSKMPE